ncbi:VanW family protein [Planotetraspora sp. GP83]|uniref:VanW family protein n=1 Tax=Planotetraspora sp. GP83 TaxID=3156264 RepID=UPI003511AF27
MSSIDPGEPGSAPSGRRRRKAAILGVTAVLALAVVGYVVAAAALSGKVPPGTRVAGVGIGGLSPAAAESRLRREMAATAARPVTAEVAGKRVRLSPDAIGLSVDYPGTVAAAGGGWPSPAGVVRALLGTRELAPRVDVDEERLTVAVAELATTVDKPAREGRVSYRGLEPQAVLPRAGRALDQAEAARTLRAAYLQPDGPVPLPIGVVRPKVPASEVGRVADTTARTAVAAPVKLTNGSRQATLTPGQLAAHLRFASDGDGAMRPSFDAASVAVELQDDLIGADLAPKDAGFTIVNGKPRVVPAREGRGIDAAALGRSVADAVTGGGSRTVVVPVTRGKPRLTTEQARGLGVAEKVGSFTTAHPCCAPRVTNIHRIADIVDGHVVMPGETFSLNGVVGERDKARGFVEAPMILNGRYVNAVGGGVSQFATTMFNAVFFGGFQDVQHTPHSFYISRYPAGRESTVSYPQPDFRWRNDSPYGVLIKTSYTSTSLTVQFWSTKRFDIESQSSARYNVKGFATLTDSGPRCIPMTGVEGFAIDVWRIFRKDGEVVRKQKFHTVYTPEPSLTCGAGS